MSIEVRPLDVWDDDEFAAAYAVHAEAETYGRTDPQVDEPEALRAGLVHPSASMAQQAWMARLDGRPAGVLVVAWPVVDDLQTCWPMLGVAPAMRRRGVGAALHATLLRAVRMAGRSLVQVEVTQPAGSDGDGPGAAFARRHGYELALREVQMLLRLPVPPERLAAEPGGGYTLRTWRDSCPADLVDGYCRLRETFGSEAPTGDLVTSAQHWDEARVRDQERRRAEQGRTFWTTVALSPGGEVVGFTELVALLTATDASQNQTLVLPEHRGHRLGMAMKAANLRRLGADLPGVRRVHSAVAPDNTPMRRVNEELGFVACDLLDEWQLTLPQG